MPFIINENQLLSAVTEYQRSGSDQDGETVLKLLEPIVVGMVRRSCTYYGADVEEVRSRVWLKMLKALQSFQPHKGKAFSYFNCVCQNATRTYCSETIARNERFATTSLEALDDGPQAAINPWPSRWQVEELTHRLMQLRTTCTKPNELMAQKWLCNNLLETGFSYPRHKLVYALRVVFGVDLRQGRLIHDRTVLELRRTLLPHLLQLNGHKFPVASRLRGRHSRGLCKYRGYLDAAEFARLAHLLAGLAPAIVDDHVARELRALNGDRAKRRDEVIRRCLLEAIHGYPHARPLFSGNGEARPRLAG
jgi:hypothetical protein